MLPYFHRQFVLFVGSCPDSRRLQCYWYVVVIWYFVLADVTWMLRVLFAARVGMNKE